MPRSRQPRHAASRGPRPGDPDARTGTDGPAAGAEPDQGTDGVANESGLRALGQQIDDAAPPRRSTRRRRMIWAHGSVGVVVVLLAGAVAGYAWYLNHEIHRVKVGDLTADTGGPENILMVGSTNRCALKVQNPAYGLCSEGVNGVNSDVVMILHVNPATKSLSILSVPRDLFVPNARQTGANKIDAALYEGPTQLVDAVSEDFGIPIQHFVELNFDSFANVVDALGGIKMYFPMPVYDQYSGLNVESTGCLSLNGLEALQVVRARHLQYKGPGVTTSDPTYWPFENQSDLARIRRDHEFLRVLGTAVSQKGLANPLTDEQIVSSVVGQLEVDSGFTANDMINLVLNYHSVNPTKAPQLTLPVMVDQFGDYVYQGGDYGDIEFPDQPLDQQVVDRFLGISASTNSVTGHPLPAPGTVAVSVLNGTGAYDQAAQTGSALSALGFHVVHLGDQAPVGQEAETVVAYASRQGADPAAAQAVAHSLTGAVIMAYDPSLVSPGAQVTVVTGTDFAVVSPPPPPSTTTTTAAGAGSAPTTTPPTTATTATTAIAPTTTTTAPNANGPFSPPSSSVEPLAPWDPRACTPSGGEGT